MKGTLSTAEVDRNAGQVVDKTIRKFASFEEMKDAEYREWQALFPQARLDAAAELSRTMYGRNGSPGDIRPGFQRTLVRVQRTPR